MKFESKEEINCAEFDNQADYCNIWADCICLKNDCNSWRNKDGKHSRNIRKFETKKISGIDRKLKADIYHAEESPT